MSPILGNWWRERIYVVVSCVVSSDTSINQSPEYIHSNNAVQFIVKYTTWSCPHANIIEGKK